jgi:hypothetical protein
MAAKTASELIASVYQWLGTKEADSDIDPDEILLSANEAARSLVSEFDVWYTFRRSSAWVCGQLLADPPWATEEAPESITTDVGWGDLENLIARPERLWYFGQDGGREQLFHALHDEWFSTYEKTTSDPSGDPKVVRFLGERIQLGPAPMYHTQVYIEGSWHEPDLVRQSPGNNQATSNRHTLHAYLYLVYSACSDFALHRFEKVERAAQFASLANSKRKSLVRASAGRYEYVRRHSSQQFGARVFGVGYPGVVNPDELEV